VRACFGRPRVQAHFGEFIRNPERPAGVALDAVQTVPDSVRVHMQLGGGIGDRAFIDNPLVGVEADTLSSSRGQTDSPWEPMITGCVVW
jgi:hypothetical protein